MNPPFKFLQPYVIALVTGVAILTAFSTVSMAAGNTAYGVGALKSGASTGTDDSAFGLDALYSTTTGVDNTASGVNALFFNKTGDANTAAGQGALYSNTKASANTATGFAALHFNPDFPNELPS